MNAHIFREIDVRVVHRRQKLVTFQVMSLDIRFTCQVQSAQAPPTPGSLLASSVLLPLCRKYRVCSEDDSVQIFCRRVESI